MIGFVPRHPLIFCTQFVLGVALATAGPTPTIATPTTRHIAQRSAGNTADIPISGGYSGNPDSIEARAVVMAGSGNSGVATGWQTLVNQPAGGSYSGVLAAVAAGGWYQIEVRAVTAGSPGTAAVVEKIGVGDIFVTAGQSNAGNEGFPPLTPTEDRVSTRTSFTASTWRHAYDPQPLVSSTGGSPWSRLGNLLVPAEQVPIGFVCVAVGGTTSLQWLPGAPSGYYNNRLKPVLQSLGPHGFRAVLWHQGEQDSYTNVTNSTHVSNLNTIIAQSRGDAGWHVPWIVAEVSYSPATTLTQEEPVAAADRQVAYADPDVFLGPTTDEFHLEDANGGKMIADDVHFNAAGLASHARQWRDILTGNTSPTLRNGNIEENRDPTITGLPSLADGGFIIANTTIDTDSPLVLGWRILGPDHIHAADGSNGFVNPKAPDYAAALDSINGGVMPGMNGRHVAFLFNGSAGNHYLQTTRGLAQPYHIYTLTVAIGVRDYVTGFGNARIEILANGQPMAAATFDKTALDAIHGGDSAGSFNDVSVSWQTGASVPPGQPLAVRITRILGGNESYLDFDNARLTDVPLTPFQQWQVANFGSFSAPEAQAEVDFDEDGLANGIEYFMGTPPAAADALPAVATVEHSGRTWARYSIPLDPAVADGGFELQYSLDLATWNPAATSEDGSIVATRLADSWTLEIDRALHPQAFFRLHLAEVLSP